MISAPAISDLGVAQETAHHVLRIGTPDTFQVPCLKLDDAFITFANARFGTTWDGALPLFDPRTNVYTGGVSTGLGNGFGFQSFQDPGPFNLLLFRDFTVTSQFFPWIEVQYASNYTLGWPTFGGYSFFDWSGGHGTVSDPDYLTHTPLTFNILPCDVSAPPSKVGIGIVQFSTPDGPIGMNAPVLHPVAAPLGTLKWRSVSRPIIGGHQYTLEFLCVISSGQTYVLQGCARTGNTLTYAEFDGADNPSVADDWPVGTFLRGNAHGFENLAAGITCSSAVNCTAIL